MHKFCFTRNLKYLFLKKALNAGPQNIGKKFYNKLLEVKKNGGDDINISVNLIFELSKKNNKINGKIISALWDEWHKFKYNFKKLNASDVYTLRRIVGKERNLGFLISKKLNVIIIGCGLIGNKRAKFLNNKFSKLVYCCDIKEKKAIQFAKKYKCTYVKNYKKVDLNKIDVAFICTTHNFLFSISKFF